jgi:hypothetical protein
MRHFSRLLCHPLLALLLRVWRLTWTRWGWTENPGSTLQSTAQETAAGTNYWGWFSL